MNIQNNLFNQLDPFAYNVTKSSEGLERNVKAGRYSHKSIIKMSNIDDDLKDIDPFHAWTIQELRQKSILGLPKQQFSSSMSVVDFFCGAGGLSLGIKKALEALNIQAKFELAVDLSKEALKVYKHNLRAKKTLNLNVDNLLDVSSFEEINNHQVPNITKTRLSKELSDFRRDTDIFVAGPPCQGNSNLNNKSRRTDPRNELYLTSAAIAVKLNAKIIIIENVPSVTASKQEVVERTRLLLEHNGYAILNKKNILMAANLLVAQTRGRHFLIAIKSKRKKLFYNLDKTKFPLIPVLSVIKDLEEKLSQSNPMYNPASLSKENIERVDFLHDRAIYDLPDEMRPYCHKEKAHTYPAVYGRMRPDLPAPTLTTGFQSPGRGRYVHPTKRRTLTAQEAARIQSFPDYYKFAGLGLNTPKNSIVQFLGDAVPPNLGMFVCLAALSAL